MTKEVLLDKLRELASSSDLESAHSDADDLLIDFINDSEIRKAYDKIDKWYA